ncbi:hypothetical protein F9K99_19590 [Brucella anthropi]|nr:hypothetical protein F9K99_19590 [Brucella anthropi]
MQTSFDKKFNSRTIREAHGKHFAEVVCAAAPGSMFEANRLPEEDGQRIDALIDDLSKLVAERFVLISTIAVFDSFDAGYDESASNFQRSLAYGRNRHRLEEFCATHFSDTLIVRLPALFGHGLKKNFIFDIMNPMPSMLTADRLQELRSDLPAKLGIALADIYTSDENLGLMVIDRSALDRSGLRSAFDEAVSGHPLNAVNFTNPETRFQYYDMLRLWSDICTARQDGLKIIHLSPEPVPARDVYKALVGQEMPSTNARVHKEDLRTRHGDLWGRAGPYLAGVDEVLKRLGAFYRAEKQAV